MLGEGHYFSSSILSISMLAFLVSLPILFFSIFSISIKLLSILICS